MAKISSLRKKLSKSGQINIAETVVSATIILVLAVSVAQLGSTVSLSQSTNNTDIIKKKAQTALDLGLSLGYVRQLAYSTNPTSPSMSSTRTAMQSLIAENLPLSAQYSLFQRTTNNQADQYNNRTLLGITPIPSGNLNIFSVSVLVSGYFDSNTAFLPSYTVTLIVALGDS